MPTLRSTRARQPFNDAVELSAPFEFMPLAPIGWRDMRSCLCSLLGWLLGLTGMLGLYAFAPSTPEFNRFYCILPTIVLSMALLKRKPEALWCLMTAIILLALTFPYDLSPSDYIFHSTFVHLLLVGSCAFAVARIPTRIAEALSEQTLYRLFHATLALLLGAVAFAVPAEYSPAASVCELGLFALVAIYMFHLFCRHEALSATNSAPHAALLLRCSQGKLGSLRVTWKLMLRSVLAVTAAVVFHCPWLFIPTVQIERIVTQRSQYPFTVSQTIPELVVILLLMVLAAAAFLWSRTVNTAHALVFFLVRPLPPHSRLAAELGLFATPANRQLLFVLMWMLALQNVSRLAYVSVGDRYWLHHTSGLFHSILANLALVATAWLYCLLLLWLFLHPLIDHLERRCAALNANSEGDLR